MKDDEAGRVLTVASKALQALRVAIGVVRLYPDPAGQPGMDRALESFSNLELPIRMDVTTTGFRLAGRPIPQDVQSEKISRALFERGVEELHVRSAPQAQELIALARLVSAEPEEIESSGGASAYLASNAVMSLRVTNRKLHVTAGIARSADQQEPHLPERLRGERELTEKLESYEDPAEALAHLESLFEESQDAGVEEVTLQAGIADAIAELSEGVRASLMGQVMGRLDAALPRAIIGQLSDGEISDALVVLATDEGGDTVMGFAREIVERSRGRRKELPVILARKLLNAGVATPAVTAAAESMAGDASLTIEDAEEDIDLAELREESLDFGTDGFHGAILTMRALFLIEEEEADFERLVEHAEDSIRKWADDLPNRSLEILELLSEMSTAHPSADRRVRFDRALRNCASADLAAPFLGSENRLENESFRRFIAAVGPRCIPLLLEQLGKEEDQGRRKSTIDLLSKLAAPDISLMLPALSDPRWFLLRNVATILGRTRRPEALPHLESLLKHRDSRVRREAVRSIGSMGDSAVASLASSLNDPAEGVRISSIGALGVIDSPSSSRHLSRFAADSRRSLSERKQAVDSLRLHTTAEAEAALRKAARRWPPLPGTFELAKYAREILDRRANR